MKQLKIRLTVISAIMILIILGTPIFAVNQSEDAKNATIETYGLEWRYFNQFIQSPSEKMLKEKSTDYRCFEKANEFARIGYMTVDKELFDYFGSHANAETFLRERGISCAVKRCIFVECCDMLDVFEIPVSIWIETNQGNYFVSIELNLTDPNVPPEYVLHTQSQYIERFKLKDGRLRIDGVDVTGQNYVKFLNKGVYLPFRFIMESAGAKISWNAENREIGLMCGSKEYTLMLSSENYFEVYNEAIPGLEYPYISHLYCIIDGRTIMNNCLMEEFLYLLNTKIEIDAQAHTVDIWTNYYLE